MRTPNKASWKLLAAAALVALLPTLGCADDEPTKDDLAGSVGDNGESDGELGPGDIGKADGAGTNFTYYSVRQDFRRCVFPLCGGFYVKRVNRAKTRCADGARQNECYVAEIDWPGLSMPAAQTDRVRAEATTLILRGEIRPRDYDSFGEFGTLAPVEAWRPGTDNAAEGLFTRVTDSGIRCITTPCYDTLHEGKINSRRSTNLSEIYLDDTGASDAEIAEATGQIAGDDGLMVAGYRYWFWDGGWQKGRYITQFFQRVQPETEVTCVVGGCSSQFCTNSADGPIVSTCEWRPEYACYRDAVCEVQPSGSCGWTQTQELQACLANLLGE